VGAIGIIHREKEFPLKQNLGKNKRPTSEDNRYLREMEENREKFLDYYILSSNPQLGIQM
jgi:hypothetical protein